jgi:hypothetical protein
MMMVKIHFTDPGSPLLQLLLHPIRGIAIYTWTPPRPHSCSRDHLPAHGLGAAGRHAGLCAHRRHAQRRVRRLQRRVGGAAHRGLQVSEGRRAVRASGPVAGCGGRGRLGTCGPLGECTGPVAVPLSRWAETAPDRCCFCNGEREVVPRGGEGMCRTPRGRGGGAVGFRELGRGGTELHPCSCAASEGPAEGAEGSGGCGAVAVAGLATLHRRLGSRGCAT